MALMTELITELENYFQNLVKVNRMSEKIYPPE